MKPRTTEELNQNIIASHIWVFFNKGDTISEYIEVQEMVYDKNNKPFISASYPLTTEHLSHLVSLNNPQQKTKWKFQGLIPENVLHIESHGMSPRLIWLCREKKRKLYFHESFGIPEAEFIVPNLIFDFSENKTNIYALSSKEPAINDDTELCYAPFGNINSEGSLCWGNVQKGKIEFNDFNHLIKQVEFNFFNSYFTHMGDGNKMFNVNLANYWACEEAKKSFNYEILIPNGRLLAELTD